MTVRWKPLLILSGLFLVVALVGVVAITMTLVPRSSQGILKLRASGPRGRPLRGCRDLLQAGAPARGQERRDPRGVCRAVPRLVRSGPAPREGGAPRRTAGPPRAARSSSTRRSRVRGKQLLKDAMNQDLVADSIYWAKEILNVEPDDPDAHYVLAAEALEERTPNVPETRRHLKVLEEKKAPPSAGSGSVRSWPMRPATPRRERGLQRGRGHGASGAMPDPVDRIA